MQLKGKCIANLVAVQACILPCGFQSPLSTVCRCCMLLQELKSACLAIPSLHSNPLMTQINTQRRQRKVIEVRFEMTGPQRTPSYIAAMGTALNGETRILQCSLGIGRRHMQQCQGPVAVHIGCHGLSRARGFIYSCQAICTHTTARCCWVNGLACKACCLAGKTSLSLMPIDCTQAA